jgi:MFS family permease
MSDSRPDPYAALRLANYRYFLLGRCFFTLAMQMQTVAVSWDIYQRFKFNPGNAALALGLVGLVQVVPMLLLSLPGGQASDHLDRKGIVRYTQLLYAICSMSLLILSNDHAPVGWYYLVLGIAACGRAFSAPAITSIFPMLVPRDILPNATTWNSTSFQVSATAGPAIGGLIVAAWSPVTCYAVNVVLVSLAFVTFSLTTPAGIRAHRTPVNWDSLVGGVRFVFGTRLLFGLVCLDLFAVLLGGATALLPIFSSDILKAGPVGYGLLRGAPSLGAVLMAIVTTHLPPWRNSGRVMLGGVVGFGLSTILFGLSHVLWLSLIALVFTGIFDNVSVVVRSTVMQMITPDAMRGRVSAITFLFVSCSNEFGELESGVTARWMGPIGSVVFGGAATLLVVAVAACLFPEIGKLRRLHELKPAEIARATDEELAEKITG